MRRDFLSNELESEAGIPGRGGSPGAQARNVMRPIIEDALQDSQRRLMIIMLQGLS